jgi:pilus assembly protein CpaF
MFGRRTNEPGLQRRLPAEPVASPSAAASAPAAAPVPVAPTRTEPVESQRHHSEEYYDVKTTVFNALIDTIDLTQLAKLDSAAAREEIRDIAMTLAHRREIKVEKKSPLAPLLEKLKLMR